MGTSRSPRESEPSEYKNRIIVSVPLSEIDFENMELCFRMDLNVSNLKEDIHTNGQQFPVILRTVDTSDKYQIVSGFRRCTALRELGCSRVDAEIRKLDDDEAYYLSYVENDKRKNLSAMDKALAISKLLARGKSPQEIQSMYGIGERQYYRQKTVTDFPSALKDAVSDGFVQITHGLVLMEAQKARRGGLDFDEWIDWIIENSASVRRLKQALKARYRLSEQHRMKKTDNGGFRFSSFSFDPKNADWTLSENILVELKEAVSTIERWIDDHEKGKI